LDKASHRKTKPQILPLAVAGIVARLMEWFTPNSKVPTLSRFVVHAISNPKHFNADKIRALGFSPKYTLSDTVQNILTNVEEDYGLKKEINTQQVDLHQQVLP
jgi:hypothetical protein